MSDFKVHNWVQNGILYLYSMRHSLDLNPEYQRQGDIWPTEKKQLLIDSVLNNFDIPKFYIHELSKPYKIKGHQVNQAIVDGKQRLSALWDFIENRFALDDDFELLEDKTVEAQGMTYAELGSVYPELKMRFDGTGLAIVGIQTDDIELIEEMFTRLNEAAPLNAAEKRNALGGPLPRVIRRLSRDTFFTEILPFDNRRYRHYDLAAKFLWTENRARVVDTKKVYLDEFVKNFRGRRQSTADRLEKRAAPVLAAASHVFRKRDPLLRRVGIVIVYYHLFRLALESGKADEIQREMLEAFEHQRQANREVAEIDIAKAEYAWLEFDRLNQTPNDGYAIELRVQIMAKFLEAEYGVDLDLPPTNEPI